MDATKHDGIVFFYNFAVIFSAGHLVRTYEIVDRTSLFLMAFLLGAAWTVYFRWSMVERFTDHPKLTQESPEEA